MDDFSTGSRANLRDVEARVGGEAWARFELLEASVEDAGACRHACARAPVVLHQAALGSVPRSIEHPARSFAANVGGFASLLEAARVAGVPRFVYASSSSVYGDHPELPRREPALGDVLSPYAASKRMDELWAQAAHRAHGVPAVGLRYFNLFGPRQAPDGPYAAVIPRWITALLAGTEPELYGDGATSRDFCPVENAVQANLLAARGDARAAGGVFNVALGGDVTLNELFAHIVDGLAARGVDRAGVALRRRPERPGDVRHSRADVGRAREVLEYEPEVDFAEGLARTLDHFVRGFAPSAP